jgi:hypothetical protein
MFGFVIGTVSLFALIATLRRGHYGHGRGRGFRRLVRRLQASPSQEDVLRGVADGFFATGRATREDVRALRSALSSVLETESLDESALDEALARFDAATARLRETLLASTRTVHSTLDASQRKRLVGFFNHGWHGHRHAC